MGLFALKATGLIVVFSTLWPDEATEAQLNPVISQRERERERERERAKVLNHKRITHPN